VHNLTSNPNPTQTSPRESQAECKIILDVPSEENLNEKSLAFKSHKGSTMTFEGKPVEIHDQRMDSMVESMENGHNLTQTMYRQQKKSSVPPSRTHLFNE
jgi:hypothetical protein